MDLCFLHGRVGKVIEAGGPGDIADGEHESVRQGHEVGDDDLGLLGKLYAHLLPGAPLSMKVGEQSTLGYTQGIRSLADGYASYELDGDTKYRQRFYPNSAVVRA